MNKLAAIFSEWFRPAPKPFPKIIHQIWDGPKMPDEISALSQTWKRHHLGWQYYLWNKAAGRYFVARNYPELLTTWTTLPKDIQRFDMLRCLVLDFFGGIYADADTECLKPFDPLLTHGEDFICGFEAKPYPSICNAILGSVPGHPIWAAMRRYLAEVRDYSAITATDVSHVFATTGSLALTPLILAHKTSRTRIFANDIFYPFSWAQKERCNDPFPHAYAKHYWVSGWYEEGAYKVDAYWQTGRYC